MVRLATWEAHMAEKEYATSGKNFRSTISFEFFKCLFGAASIRAKDKNNWLHISNPSLKKTDLFVLDKTALCESHGFSSWCGSRVQSLVHLAGNDYCTTLSTPHFQRILINRTPDVWPNVFKK